MKGRRLSRIACSSLSNLHNILFEFAPSPPSTYVEQLQYMDMDTITICLHKLSLDEYLYKLQKVRYARGKIEDRNRSLSLEIERDAKPGQLPVVNQRKTVLEIPTFPLLHTYKRSDRNHQNQVEHEIPNLQHPTSSEEPAPLQYQANQLFRASHFKPRLSFPGSKQG